MTNRFRFISTHRASYGVKRLCRVLAVSRSGFYRWIAAEPARRDRAAAEDQLAELAAVHTDSGGTYGSPRVTAELRGQCVQVNRKRVERVMRRRGIAGRHLRRSPRPRRCCRGRGEQVPGSGRSVTLLAQPDRFGVQAGGNAVHLQADERAFQERCQASTSRARRRVLRHRRNPRWPGFGVWAAVTRRRAFVSARCMRRRALPGLRSRP